MAENSINELKAFLEILGISEEPFGVFYTDQEPKDGFTPKSRSLPTLEEEKGDKIDWGLVFEGFSCVIGLLWRARKKGTSAYFSKKGYKHLF